MVQFIFRLLVLADMAVRMIESAGLIVADMTMRLPELASIVVAVRGIVPR
jgi:hypothetical protein